MCLGMFWRVEYSLKLIEHPPVRQHVHGVQTYPGLPLSRLLQGGVNWVNNVFNS